MRKKQMNTSVSMLKIVKKQKFIQLLALLIVTNFSTPVWAETTQYKSIVSIGGSVTEIIYALGEQDRLVARDTTSTFPNSAKRLPDVGYIRRLSPEGVLSVNPDLIIALEGSGPPEAMATLREANLPIVEIPEGYSKDNILKKIKAIGSALGVPEKAESLAEEIKDRFENVANQTNFDVGAKKVLFVLAMREGRILAAGSGTGADSIINLAGSKNAISEFDGYKPVSDEAIITSQPDVILMMKRSGNHAQTNDEILSHPAIATTPAGKNKKIVRMDGLYLLGFGPRTAFAIQDLNKALQ